jgi:cyclophilin family peptidyl-prolyl cis-trans isomerase/HEAT repeat protein
MLGSCADDEPTPQGLLLWEVMDAEDARGLDSRGLEPILTALESSDPRLQATAVRALGRLEDPEQVEILSSFLSASYPEVRLEAANALGQSVFNVFRNTVAPSLLEALSSETDARVMGALGRTLGRLKYENPLEMKVAENALVGLTLQDGQDAPVAALRGSLMGMEWLTRQNRSLELEGSTLRRVEALTSFGLAGGEVGVEESATLRRVAHMVLMNAGALSPEMAERGIHDTDPDVRRLMAASLRQTPGGSSGLEILGPALSDGVPRVRTQALVSAAAMATETERCRILLDAVGDPHPQVAITALDLLETPCPHLDVQITTLLSFIQGDDASSSTRWHRGAHALRALATVSPSTAAPHLSTLAAHPSPFARVYAAQAAGQVGEVGEESILEGLARDNHPNVRTAATQALFRLQGHDVDHLLLEQLKEDDPQLLLTAANLLEGTERPQEATHQLLATLERISAWGMETFRDPRYAILEVLGEVAADTDLTALDGYLSDYDPAVAELTAQILASRLGGSADSSPNPPPRVPLPTLEELDRMSRIRVVLEMEGGGKIEIRLFPYLAPTNAARFVHLAESGVFDGLTFHRVVANFVVQGLSPNANEMAGHGRFTRDEIGLQSNWRGTVGTSTRGRDTGDGQIFINVIDNLRLDHNYTIFGEVSAGMDVVDDVVEGQRVLRARVVEG